MCELVVLTFSTEYCLDLAQLKHRLVIVTTFVDIDYLLHCDGFRWWWYAIDLSTLRCQIAHEKEKGVKCEMTAPSDCDCDCDDNDDGRQEKRFSMMPHMSSYILCVRSLRRAYFSRFTDHVHSPYPTATPISKFQFTDCVCKVDGPLILMNYFRSRFFDTLTQSTYVSTLSQQHTIQSLTQTRDHIHRLDNCSWNYSDACNRKKFNCLYLAMEYGIGGNRIQIRWRIRWEIRFLCRSHSVLLRWWVVQIKNRFGDCRIFLVHSTFISLNLSESLKLYELASL